MLIQSWKFFITLLLCWSKTFITCSNLLCLGGMHCQHGTLCCAFYSNSYVITSWDVVCILLSWGFVLCLILLLACQWAPWSCRCLSRNSLPFWCLLLSLGVGLVQVMVALSSKILNLNFNSIGMAIPPWNRSKRKWKGAGKLNLNSINKQRQQLCWTRKKNSPNATPRLSHTTFKQHSPEKQKEEK